MNRQIQMEDRNQMAAEPYDIRDAIFTAVQEFMAREAESRDKAFQDEMRR